MNFLDPFGLDVNITINRTGRTDTSITGTISVTSTETDQSFDGYTVEDANPPNPNLPVPEGEYSAHVDQRDGRTDRVELGGVPNASDVQIHVGNTADDVEVAFAVGTTAEGDDAVGNSAMSQINSIIAADGTGNITVTVTGGP